MKDLSVSQAYLLCVLNESGKFSALDTESPICLLAGGLIDLLLANCVAIGKDKKLRVTGELDDTLRHLESLYHFIRESKPMKAEALASQYALTFSDKKNKLLLGDVGTSLATLGYVSPESGGLFGKTLCFIPNKEMVDHVIQNIRAELLEDGTVSDHIIALVSLMDKSGQLKRYFSKYEKDQLKARLKEIKDTGSYQLIREMVDHVAVMIAVITASGTAH